VYPLTEDVQPGDIFLVTTPIGQEAAQYTRRGFLPLDQHLGRLHDLDFSGFYQKSFGVADHSDTPHHWQFPERPSPGQPPGSPAESAAAGHRIRNGWANAPRAAFPSYSFQVKGGSGLSLAIPVQGVPLGLSFLQAGSAAGTITIADGYVYGVSHGELAEQLRDWAAIPERRTMFQAMRQDAGRPLYVRVVNRVYLAGSVNVALRSEKSAGGSASGGQPKEVALLEAGDNEAAHSYVSMLDMLNKKVADSLPGGTLKFAQASSRAVTMNEVFERPLAIGYLAFDFPILEDGTLGAPVSTLERVERKSNPEVRLGELTPRQVDFNILVAAISSRSEDTQLKIYDAAAEQLGDPFKDAYSASRGEGRTPKRSFSDARRSWLKEHANGADLVLDALRSAWDQNLGNQ
jgi:hypothetical protein